MRSQLNIDVDRRGQIRRRQFLQGLSAVSVAAGTLTMSDRMRLQAAELERSGMSCIILWMGGAPSQFETFSPKPNHKNGGETKAISTNVSGIQISDNLPNVAGVMDELCVIRSLNSKEGSHPRGTHLMHTSYVPTAAVKYPTLGSHVAHQLGDSSFDLPGFIRVGQGRGSGGAGLLGVEYAPFNVSDADRQPDNTQVYSNSARYRRRLGLLGKLEDQFAENGGAQEVADHRKIVEKSSRMILSPLMNAFDISQESSRTRAAYGESKFASGCLLARRLVEAGVSCVEVNLGNWDTHQDNFSRTKDLCNQLDQPYAALIRDLRERGMLEKTLVVWMGEFGRTPRINARGGRDHYPRAFNVALAGASIRGGQVIGETDAGGEQITERPVGVDDFFRTMYHSLGIDADHENDASGRPVPIVEHGEIVKEALG